MGCKSIDPIEVCCWGDDVCYHVRNVHLCVGRLRNQKSEFIYMLEGILDPRHHG